MKNKTFEQNTFFYKQLRETAIETIMAPPYIVLGNLKEKLLKDYDKKSLEWCRYTDDIFILWQHWGKELESA